MIDTFLIYYFIQLSIDTITYFIFRLGWIGYFNEKKLEIGLDGVSLLLILLPLPIATISLSLNMLMDKEDIGNIKSIKKGWNILFSRSTEKNGIPHKTVKIKDYNWLPDEIYIPLKKITGKKFQTGTEFHIPWKYGLNLRLSFTKFDIHPIIIRIEGTKGYMVWSKNFLDNKERYDIMMKQIEDELHIVRINFNPFLSENSKIQQRRTT